MTKRHTSHISDEKLVRKLLSEKLEMFDEKRVLSKALAKALRPKPRRKVHHKAFYEK